MITHGSTLMELVSEAASVFIKGISSNPLVSLTVDAAHALLEQLTQRSLMDYRNKSLIPMDQVKRSIASISVYAGQRSDYLQSAINAIDYETNFLDYLYEEMTAAEALLNSIQSNLINGKLDTQALGELSEYQMLMAIDANDTWVTKISEELNENAEDNGIVVLEFQFKVITRLKLTDRIKWDSIIIAFILFSLLTRKPPYA